MTIKECIDYGIEKLNNIEDKSLKVRIILAHFLGVDKNYLLTHDSQVLSKVEETEFKNAIEKLSNNVPLQYITGIQEFYGLKFKVNENVLIPRFDTEILVEEVLKVAKSEHKILDMCTGSGILAITTAKKVEKTKVYASDISKDALKLAKENADAHQVKVKFIESDLFENIEEKDFDIIMSNPPYINKKDMENLDEQVKKEPEIALYGGIDGLDFYKKITEHGYKYLKKGGYLFFEIGYDQGKEVISILKENNFKNVRCVKDLHGLDRVIIGEKE